jgi:uncharacterized protein (DUF2235 family)
MLSIYRVLRRWALLLSTAIALTACGTITHKPMTSAATTPKKIAIFFDGTNNDEASDTNVKRLHSLATLQSKAEVATLYVEGVGTGTDITGMATGFGIGARVRIAYEFILNNHRPGDTLYIFGFSRGAYAARILTSLLYHAGLPKSDVLSSTRIAKVVYDDVKEELADNDEVNRQIMVETRLVAKGLTLSEPIEVEILGLWDTVEALGFQEWGSKLLDKAQLRQHPVVVDNANKQYGDKLCNVKFAFHALSIDDDREWVFTPLLLARSHLFRDCTVGRSNPMLDAGRIKPGHLQEVWFSGAHSDVGGGYQDSLLNGVSLNWMIDRISATFPSPQDNLLPAGAQVREDPYGTSHDPEAGSFSLIYHRMNRNLVGYASDTRNQRREVLGSICVHRSVFERRALIQAKAHENHQLLFNKAGPVSLIPICKKDDACDISLKDRLREKSAEDPDTNEQLTTIDIQQYPRCNLMQ